MQRISGNPAANRAVRLIPVCGSVKQGTASAYIKRFNKPFADTGFSGKGKTAHPASNPAESRYSREGTKNAANSASAANRGAKRSKKGREKSEYIYPCPRVQHANGGKERGGDLRVPAGERGRAQIHSGKKQRIHPYEQGGIGGKRAFAPDGIFQRAVYTKGKGYGKQQARSLFGRKKAKKGDGKRKQRAFPQKGKHGKKRRKRGAADRLKKLQQCYVHGVSFSESVGKRFLFQKIMGKNKKI